MTRPAKILLFVSAFVIYDYLTSNPNDGFLQGAILDMTANINAATGGANMTTSPAGIQAIQQREGLRQSVYLDTLGNMTGGYGHLLTAIERAQYNTGDAIGLNTIAAWFTSDIAHAENLVNVNCGCTLTQNQFDALVSASYNLGGKLWTNSDGSQTQINNALDAGDIALAASDLMLFDKPPEIISRRQSEQAQFLS
jgi:GH24 family phage-related lysozyme (muramidase)